MAAGVAEYTEVEVITVAMFMFVVAKEDVVEGDMVISPGLPIQLYTNFYTNLMTST